MVKCMGKKKQPNQEEEFNPENDLEEEIMADLAELDENLVDKISADEKSGEDPIGDDSEADVNLPKNNSDIVMNTEIQNETGNIEDEQAEDVSSEEESDSSPLDQKRKRNIVEAALFVAGKPISIEDISIKTEFKKKDIEQLLHELMLDYMERPTAMEIVQVADKYVLQIKPEYTQDVKKFASGGAIPEAELKTLTIIALKQPLMKSTLIKLRGSTAYDHVKSLMNRGFIEAYKKSRSQELVTTDLFADTFGLAKDITTLKKQLIAQLGINPNQDNP
jgi:segregation and condensation protein B